MAKSNDLYDVKIYVRSSVKLLGEIKDLLERNPNRERLFRRTVFGPWLDILSHDNDNHLMHYVLQHQRIGIASLGKVSLWKDFDSWNDYPWGEYMWEIFYKRTTNVVAMHRADHLKKKKQNSDYYPTYNLYGFAWAFKDSNPNLELYATPIEKQAGWFIASIQFINGLVDEDFNVSQDDGVGVVSGNCVDLQHNSVSTVSVLSSNSHEGLNETRVGNNDMLLLEGETVFWIQREVDELIDVHEDKTTVLQENVKDQSNKSQYVNVVTDDYKPCLGMVFANVKAKRKKCSIERNYVLRSIKERKKRLAMALDSPFGQQATTTPAPPKTISRSVNGDFIAPPEFLEETMGAKDEENIATTAYFVFKRAWGFTEQGRSN
ncbi:hypothetical protein Tco_0589369 [Tanacetum coccineum]